MRTSFIKFHNFLLIFSVCITSNATDYKLEQLDEKTIYSNSEHELNSVYSDIKGANSNMRCDSFKSHMIINK
ncbi:hypothetical protein ACHBZ4_07645, partial [Acinetobacter baumannii]